MMTGLRSTEARSLRWQDVDLDADLVTIRDTIAKNHRGTRLPLNGWLVDQLKARKERANTDLIFGAGPGMRYLDNLRRPIEELHRLSGIRATPHDLRRSFATYLDAVGTPFGAIKQLLNHVSSADITARYIQRRSIEELRQYAEDVFALINSAHERRPHSAYYGHIVVPAAAYDER
jgi:integrase